MLNKAILMGRLTRDPELRHTQSNIPVTSFTLAVDRGYTKPGEEKQTDFIDIVAWRNTAEFVSRYFRKGQLVAVTGRIQTRKWQDQQGNNRVSVEVVADEAFFAEAKRDGQGQSFAPSYDDAPSPASYAPQTGGQYPSAPQGGRKADNQSNSYSSFQDDDELPF